MVTISKDLVLGLSRFVLHFHRHERFLLLYGTALLFHEVVRFSWLMVRIFSPKVKDLGLKLAILLDIQHIPSHIRAYPMDIRAISRSFQGISVHICVIPVHSEVFSEHSPLDLA